jgi:hypothetical protein
MHKIRNKIDLRISNMLHFVSPAAFIEATTKAGRASGKITSQKAFTTPAPSIRAASTNSSGMLAKKFRKDQRAYRQTIDNVHQYQAPYGSVDYIESL